MDLMFGLPTRTKVVVAQLFLNGSFSKLHAKLFASTAAYADVENVLL
jgi:hypothetical protein